MMKLAALACVILALTVNPALADDTLNADYYPTSMDDLDRVWWGYNTFHSFDEAKLATNAYWLGNGDTYPEGTTYHSPGWQTMGLQCFKEYHFCISDENNGNGGQGHPDKGIPYCNCLSADCAPKVDVHFKADADGTSCGNLVPERDPAHDYFDGEKSELMYKLKSVPVVPDLDSTTMAAANTLIAALNSLEAPDDAEAIHTLASALNDRLSAGKGPYSKVMDIADLDLEALAASVGYTIPAVEAGVTPADTDAMTMVDFCNNLCVPDCNDDSQESDNVDDWTTSTGALCFPRCEYGAEICYNCERCGSIEGVNPYGSDTAADEGSGEDPVTKGEDPVTKASATVATASVAVVVAALLF